MTEEEAKTRWCPAARYSDNDNGVNRFNPDGAFSSEYERRVRCIGSACMAWRWKEQPTVGRRLNPDKPNLTDMSGNGFCGLAGASQ